MLMFGFALAAAVAIPSVRAQTAPTAGNVPTAIQPRDDAPGVYKPRRQTGTIVGRNTVANVTDENVSRALESNDQMSAALADDTLYSSPVRVPMVSPTGDYYMQTIDPARRGSKFYSTHSPEDQRMESKTRALVEKIRKAEDEPERSKTVRELREVLDEHFELRMKDREKQLAELEQRLAKLRQQIDRRRSAKEEIVELRLTTLINEAKGLGF